MTSKAAKRVLSSMIKPQPSPSKSKRDRDNRKKETGDLRTDAVEDDSIEACDQEMLFNGGTIMASPEDLRLKSLQDQLRDAVRTNDKEYAEELRQEISEIKDRQSPESMAKKLDKNQKSEEKKAMGAASYASTGGSMLIMPDSDLPIDSEGKGGVPNTYSYETPDEENDIEEQPGSTHSSQGSERSDNLVEVAARYQEFKANVEHLLKSSVNDSWNKLVAIATRISRNDLDVDAADHEIRFSGGKRVGLTSFIIAAANNGLHLVESNPNSVVKLGTTRQRQYLTNKGERITFSVDDYDYILTLDIRNATTASRISANKRQKRML